VKESLVVPYRYRNFIATEIATVSGIIDTLEKKN